MKRIALILVFVLLTACTAQNDEDRYISCIERALSFAESVHERDTVLSHCYYLGS